MYAVHTPQGRVVKSEVVIEFPTSTIGSHVADNLCFIHNRFSSNSRRVHHARFAGGESFTGIGGKI